MAQQAVTVHADAIFYGDNTEFRNPFREGETIFGTAARAEARADLNDRVALSGGVFGNLCFGSDSSFELVRPVLTMEVRGRRSRFLLGRWITAAGVSSGPDSHGSSPSAPADPAGNARVRPPVQAGLQWLFKGPRLEHDMWLQWQRLNTPDHRERLDAGTRLIGDGAASSPLRSRPTSSTKAASCMPGPGPGQFRLASGIELSPRPESPPPSGRPREQPIAKLDGSLELLGLWSHHMPDRQQPARTRDGAGFFGRAAVERFSWRAHLIMWRGDNYMKDEGDPNYQSIRRDGTRWRGVRDYAETGLTKTFDLAPGALIEVSLREPPH